MAKFKDPFDNSEFAASFLSELTPQVKTQPKAEGGFLSDMGTSFGSGAGQLVESVGTFLGGSDSTVAEVGAQTKEYWDERKSEELKAKEAEFGQAMQDENVGTLGILGKVISDPYLAASMVSSSAPSMALGMGLGSVVAKGMAAAGLMTETTGVLTSMGSRVAGGVGEGLVIAPDVYQNTQGDAAASAAGLALGIVTSMVTPGNIGAATARRVTGASESAIESAFNKTVARRVATAGVSEAAQEYGQEAGQAVVEQLGRGEELDLSAASKQGAVGAALGGLMGVGLHPVVGEGAPTRSPAQEEVAVREEALAQDPNNPVLQAELANARAVEQHLANPSEATELQVAATVANLEAARNPDSRELADQAEMATAAVALNTAGAEGTREAARVAANATSDAIAAAPDLDTALTAFGAGERASSTLQTTAKGIENTVKGIEVSATFEEEGENAAEIVTPEQEQKLQIQALRARNMELKNQRLAEEIERARAPAAEKQKEEISAEPAKETHALRYEAVPGEGGEWHVIDSNMDTYDTYRGPMAQQDAEAAAATLSQPAQDQIQVEEREMTPDEQAGVEMQGDQLRFHEASAAMQEMGYEQSVIEGMRAATGDQLRSDMNNIRATPQRRRMAHAILQRRGEQVMSAPAFEAREDALARGLSEIGAKTPETRRAVLDNAGGWEESLLRDVASARNRVVPSNQRAFANAALAFRQGRHMGEIDYSPQQAQAQGAPARTPTSELLRQAAAEVEAESVAPEVVVQGTHAGTRQVEMDFDVRARQARANGTLRKLGSFWKRLMSKPGQRSLPMIDTSDLKAEVRSAVGSGRAIPSRILNEVADRYNSALKEKAREWALENNQPFNEDNWIDPIQNVRSESIGRNAGFAMYIYGLGRTGANPYMVRPGSNPAHFSADASIHAFGIRQAPGSADLAYRFAAQIADLRGRGFPSDSILLTVNSLRRQLQSMSADTLFGPGVINPLTSGQSESPQGIEPEIWRNASAVEKIGLNALRAAHSISERRGRDGGATAARFTENLVFDRQGRIKAVRDPISRNGFPRGTIVTDEMLQAKVGTVDPETGVMPRATDNAGMGGVGADTARLAILNNTILAAIESDPEASIPSWISRIAQQEGSRIGGWFFSESGQAQPTVAAPISREAAVSRIKALLGDDLGQLLIDSKLVGFVNDEAELAGETFFEAEGRVQGATTPDGRILLVLNNLNEDSFDGVLQHEATHATLKALLGEKTYQQLLDKLDTLLQAGKGSNWLEEAEARIPENTAKEFRTQELAAYAVEQAANGAQDTNPLIRWAKDLLSSLRAAIIQSKHVPESLRLWAMNHIRPQDLAKLAVAGLRAQAMMAQDGTRLSTGLRTAAEYRAEIDELMVEHAAEDTTGPRRAEINAKVARLRTAWRLAEEGEYEQMRLSVAPVADAPARELNILDTSRRKPFERLAEKFREIFQQKHVRLERLLREAGVTMENLRMDTIGALDRLGSKLQTKQKDLVMKPMAQMENILVQAGFENGGVAREQMDEFLKNRHAPEYNRHIAEINPARYEMRDGVRTHVSGFDEEHPGSGIMTKDAEAAVADVFRRAEDGDKQAKAILEAEKVYRQMIEDLQDYAVAQGLEKQETIDAWREKFKNYTPFNRELNLAENLSIGSVPGSQGFSLRSGISRRAMGSGADIVSPLASSILLGLKTTTRGENAEVARTVLNFARTFTPKFMDQAGNMVPMWKVETIPNQRVLKKMNVYQVRMADGSMSPEFYNRQQATAYANNEQAAWVRANPNEPAGASGIEVQQVGNGPQNRVVVMPVPNVLNRNNVMVIPEDGENKIIVFNEQSEDAMKILSALKSNGGSNDINKWLLGPRMFARWVVATSTGYNPAFMFFNAARDIQGAMLSINADKVPGWKASDSLQLAKDFVPAMREIWRQERKEFKALHSNTGPAAEPTQGSFAWYAKKMQEHGGATGVASSIYDIESADTQLRRLYGQEKLNTMTRAAEAVDWLSRFNTAVINMGDKFARFGEGETDSPLMGWVSKHLVSEVSRMNSAAELATRTLAFKGAFDKFKAAGKSEEEAFKLAANISKNISTNFNRRGMASGLINQLYPFFNAALQGSARLAEVMFEKETYTVDKEGVPMLDQRTKLTPFGKIVLYSLPALGGVQAALLAMAGYDDDDVPAQIKDRAFVVPIWDGKYVAIPMPHGFNTIINFGREMTDALLNPKEVMQHIGRATLGQVGAFNPFGSAGNWVTDMLPAIFDAPVSLYMNKDAFGRPIAKEAPDSANPTPGFTRAKEGASKTGRVISEAVNTITGGNEDQSGFVSPTPDQIDFVLGQFTGGVGREVAKVGGLAVAGAKDLAGVEREQIPLYKLPLAGRLIGSVSEPAALHGKLFEVRSKINDKYARYKGLMERGQTEEANAFWDANPELALRGSVESFARKDSKQRKARALARNSGEVGEVNRISAEQDEKLAALLAEIDAIKRAR